MRSGRARRFRGTSCGGKGIYLKGRAWFDLNKARADSINVKTVIEWNKEYSRQYQLEEERLSNAEAKKRAKFKQKKEDLKRFMEEREQRLRNSPTPEDIQSGNALGGKWGHSSILWRLTGSG